MATGWRCPELQKPELISQLENAKNNYVLGLAAISLLSNAEARQILRSDQAQFGAYTVPFDQVADLLEGKENRDIAIREFLLSQLRALVKESFELVKSYCAESGQQQILRHASWYHFARIIRNGLSHNFRFSFSAHDKKILPISWRGRTVTETMDGQHLELAFFGYPEAWELFQDFHLLASDELK